MRVFPPYTTDYASSPWYTLRRYDGIASLLQPYIKNHQIFWCPSDNSNPSTDPTAYTSYEYRWVVAWAATSGLVTNADFGRPAEQVVYHEALDWHYGRYGLYQLSTEVRGKPLCHAVYADFHVKLWKLPSRSGTWTYDAHWFHYGDGTLANGWD